MELGWTVGMDFAIWAAQPLSGGAWPPMLEHGHAGVVKLVDAPDSKSGSERSVGSIPTARTTPRLPHTSPQT